MLKHAWLVVFAVLVASGFCTGGFCTAQESTEETDPYFLRLAVIDITNANRAMTVYDVNEDGVVDPTEQERLSWKDQIEKFDLNKDRKLTHLEIAVRYAALRDAAGVEQRHIANAKVFLKRNDENRNGQMDPEEIAKGWPSEPDEFDTNKDGIITLAEISARIAFMEGLRREMGIQQVDQVTANQAIRKNDKNQDRMLDQEEQKSAFLPLPGSQFDEDDDNKLSSMEIATMFAKYRRDLGLGESDLAQIRTMFGQFDTDKDGLIAGEEFTSASQALGKRGREGALAQLDLNQDGSLSANEAGRALSKARSQLGFDDEDAVLARRLMTRHDQNRSQFLEPDELDEPPSDVLSKQKFSAIDEDNDVRVSLVELAKYLAKLNKD